MILKKEDIKVGDWFWSGNHNYPQKIKTLSFASDLDKDLSRQEVNSLGVPLFTLLKIWIMRIMPKNY